VLLPRAVDEARNAMLLKLVIKAGCGMMSDDTVRQGSSGGAEAG
jgi:hypothetical protein